ncbi:MAG: hypothetical protein ACR2NB_04160 [Solirubrobacteraceae bacterium]
MGYPHATAVRYYTVGRLVDALENGPQVTIFSGDGLLGHFAALHEVAQAPAEAWTPLRTGRPIAARALPDTPFFAGIGVLIRR